MQYLFICRNNLERSPTSAKYFTRLLEERHITAEVYSAGLSELAPVKLNPELIGSSNIVFLMDNMLYEEVVSTYPNAKDKIVNLDILDIFYYGKIREDLIPKVMKRMNLNEEQIQIRPEVRDKLTLQEVLDSKRSILESYIQNN